MAKPDDRNNQIDVYFIKHADYFPPEAHADIRAYLAGLDEDAFNRFTTTKFKDPDIMFWMAFPLGLLGVDRFMLGETGLGIVKLCTLGQMFIGFAVDCFTIYNRTRIYNYDRFLEIKTGLTFFN